ncbi:MAG TPA: hypothetical protein VF742_15755 [Terracidiphilus sp.]
MNNHLPRFLALCSVAIFLLASRGVQAQSLTLEGQTGGFITPTAYVVHTDKDRFFSYPAIGYSFINAHQVIGNIHTFSIVEGMANRVELGYTRNVHQKGDSELFSSFWDFPGMNVFHGKIVAVEDGQGSPFTPGLAGEFVVRTGDRFLSGAIDGLLTGTVKSYTNGDIYAVATKTWLHKPLPFIANFGFKGTNASILGIGGQSTRFQGRFFGGLGFPLPGPFHTAIVPAAGFLQQPPHSVNLDKVASVGRLPTTLDYALRVTQRDNAHFSFGIGVGQVAGTIGYTEVQPAPGAPPVIVPVNLQARSVFGVNFGWRY